MFTVIEEAGKERKIVATDAIPAGTTICQFTGRIIDYEDTLELGAKESFALQVEKKLYRLLDEPYCYFNHSCEPNCGLTPELNLITLKDVQKNEELRYDYSTTMLEHHWTMQCSCRKPNCRKVIGDFTTVPKRIQDYYLANKVVQAFIVKHMQEKAGENKE